MMTNLDVIVSRNTHRCCGSIHTIDITAGGKIILRDHPKAVNHVRAIAKFNTTACKCGLLMKDLTGAVVYERFGFPTQLESKSKKHKQAYRVWRQWMLRTNYAWPAINCISLKTAPFDCVLKFLTGLCAYDCKIQTSSSNSLRMSIGDADVEVAILRKNRRARRHPAFDLHIGEWCVQISSQESSETLLTKYRLISMLLGIQALKLKCAAQVRDNLKGLSKDQEYNLELGANSKDRLSWQSPDFTGYIRSDSKSGKVSSSISLRNLPLAALPLIQRQLQAVMERCRLIVNVAIKRERKHVKDQDNKS